MNSSVHDETVRRQRARARPPTGSPGKSDRPAPSFELLDEYVDLELASEDADTRLPGMREHLQGCPACREDHESLRDLVAQG